MTEWPGYTPPSSGSSQNDGTHPLSSYTGTETAVSAQLAGMGWDTTQQPAQAYGNITAQDPVRTETHLAPVAVAQPTVAASGTSGTAKVTWVAPSVLPSGGFDVAVTDSGTVVATVHAAPTATTINVPGLTVGHSVTAVVKSIGAWATASSTASASFTVV